MPRNALSRPAGQMVLLQQIPKFWRSLANSFPCRLQAGVRAAGPPLFPCLGGAVRSISRARAHANHLRQRVASPELTLRKRSGNKRRCLYTAQIELHKSPQRRWWCCLLRKVPFLRTLSEYGPKCFPGLGPNTCTFAWEDKISNDI